jgi:two-component sensor histidine kinase
MSRKKIVERDVSRARDQVMNKTLAVRSWTVPLRWLQVGSIVAPLLLAAIAGAWLWRAEYRHAEELVMRNAFLTAQFGLRVLSSQEQLLRHAEGLVAQMGAELDRESLQAHFAGLVAADPYSRGLALLGPDGAVLVSDRMAEPAVNWRDRAYFERLRDEQWPLFVDRIFLQPDGEDALVVAMRRPSAGFAGVLVTAVQVDVLANFLRTLTAVDGQAASLLRRDGMLLIRHQAMSEAIMVPPDRPAMQVVANQAGPLYEATATSDGVTRLYATLQLADLPYYANFGMPIAAIRAAWLRRMLLAVGALAALMAISLMIARELDRRVQARLDAEALNQTRLAAEYREMLFHELNHRVKNNLQLVESLLRLRGRGRSEEIREILGEVALRVGAIGEVHAELSGAGSELMLDLGTLLGRLMGNPALVPPERGVTVRCNAATLAVPVDRAIAVALIAVEAVTNAIKHAFPDDRPGLIEVELTEEGGRVRLAITDDGVGIRDQAPGSGHSGLQLIEALARKVDGTVEVRRDGGTQVIVTFSQQPPAAGIATAA